MIAIPELNLVDIGALILIAIGALQGFFRGLSGELARLIGTLLAFVAGVALHDSVAAWILENTRLEDQPAHAVAFIATVLIAILIMLLLRLVVKRLIKVVFAAGFDKGMGVLAGSLRMGTVVCIIFLIMNLVPHDYLNRHFGEESAIGSVVIRYVPRVRQTLERAKLAASQPTEEAPASDREDP
ncbi:MAG: CvpA family protein [Verrucomicrobia bacterium]|jgi:membrane protein required for colicin V production|nr:CvpA family protein [Verrucomicrobiota bacterium]